MTSNRPYLLRAFYEWIVDNEMTPYLVVDALQPGVQVPSEYVRDGQIVLNIAPGACNNLILGNQDLTFEARFNGAARVLTVPVESVVAIYAKENGAGTVFAMDEDEVLDNDEMEREPDPEAPVPPRPKGKPNLKVIK